MPKEIKNKIINNPLIKKVINDLKLNENQIDSGLNIFLKIIDESNSKSNNDFKTIVQVYDENNVVGISVPNEVKAKELKWAKLSVLNEISLPSWDIIFDNPKKNNDKTNKKNTFFWELEKLKKENKRGELAKWFKGFYTSMNSNLYHKGIYVYGDYGLGKTFFLKALHNYVINRGKSSTFASTSDLFDFFAKNIDKNSEQNNEAILKLKEVDLLIIDDLGNEKANNWFLFSILYQILEYRLNLNKTVCFSSIFSPSNLKKYWSKNKELDKVKIDRLIEKIISLTNQVEIFGTNLRNI